MDDDGVVLCMCVHAGKACLEYHSTCPVKHTRMPTCAHTLTRGG